jgi:hypothetical protein
LAKNNSEIGGLSTSIAYFLAMAYAALDERDEAFKHFEAAFVERDPWLVWFGTEPKLDPLRNEPRFIEIFRRTNNPLAVQRASR